MVHGREIVLTFEYIGVGRSKGSVNVAKGAFRDVVELKIMNMSIQFAGSRVNKCLSSAPGLAALGQWDERGILLVKETSRGAWFIILPTKATRYKRETSYSRNAALHRSPVSEVVRLY